MGQKIHPHLMRLGVTSNWKARWMDTKNYAKLLLSDYNIRKVTYIKLKRAASDLEIERVGNDVNLIIWTSRPGVIIGRGGAGIEELKKALKPYVLVGNLNINIQEIRNPDISAAVIANNIVEQIEKRIPFRRAIKQAIEAAKQSKAQGVRIVIAGRLNGAEIARREVFSFGKVPLHTIKYFIDYAFKTAFTTYGTIGVKVWVLPPEIKEGEVDNHSQLDNRNS
jgi:small subunit ribosomal protein S3